MTGNTVWFADNGKKALVGYDATSGRKVFQAALAGTTVQAPTVVPGRVLIGTFSGVVDGFVVPGRAAAAPTARVRRPTSWADADHGWQTRPDGVYSTEDKGRTWRRIYPHPVLASARVSRTAGVISTGSTPGVCMCTTRQFWTNDNGANWHETPTLTGSFTAGAGRVYFWSKGSLRMLASLPKANERRLESVTTLETIDDGTIVAATPAPGGVAALVSSRVATGATATTFTLPRRSGRPLAQTIKAQGANLTVTDFTVQPAKTLTWTSSNSGKSWSTGSD